MTPPPPEAANACKSYKSYEKEDPGFFAGDMECVWYAPGAFKSVQRACTAKKGPYYIKECPWNGRPDLEGK